MIGPVQRCAIEILRSLLEGRKGRTELLASLNEQPKMGTFCRALNLLMRNRLIRDERCAVANGRLYLLTDDGYREASIDKELRSCFTKIPGAAARIEVISSECRMNRGDALAIDETMARIRRALTKAVEGWPIGRNATFWVAVVVDREGRKP